jgi:hypothetical protein
LDEIMTKYSTDSGVVPPSFAGQQREPVSSALDQACEVAISVQDLVRRMHKGCGLKEH